MLDCLEDLLGEILKAESTRISEPLNHEHSANRRRDRFARPSLLFAIGTACDTRKDARHLLLCMSQMDRIQQLLIRQPGLKAQQIAKELGLDRAEVAAALHGVLGVEVTQDSAYRWWPKTREPLGSNGAATAPRTFLASLCRYYLECLARESGSGISIPVTG